MEYKYYERDAIQRKLTPVRIVRKAEKQSGSFAVLATEEPTGPQRQVLVMNGKQGRDKIPLVFPDDSSVAHVVGSVLVRVQEQRLVGVVGFAKDEAAQAVRQRYAAGEYKLHLVTSPITGVELRSGERFSGVDGPAVVVTAWEPLQAVLG
jgi:hypothetical protein